ncbi:MAG: hypothetical protein WCA46_27070, partial [Actinocatenispora sp.]
AQRLARTGCAPAGVVLLDTYEATETSALTKFQNELVGGMFDREAMFTPMDGCRLTAMSWYFGLFGIWEPERVPVPSLLVRSSEPLVPDGPDGPRPKHEWQTAWQVADSAVDVPGTHFTMMEKHAGTTAQAVQEWIRKNV